MAKTLGSLPLDALVKDSGTLYNGKPIIWQIKDKNHAGYPANSVTLITDKTISMKCFDANEKGNSSSTRRNGGNNRYLYSNIRKWLNAMSSSGWYTAQHDADAPPSSSNVYSGWGPYEAEAGFLNKFSQEFRGALIGTTLVTAKPDIDGGGSETCIDKIFLASVTEIGFTGMDENGIFEGSKFAAFSSNATRTAYPTSECVANTTYRHKYFGTAYTNEYALRTPEAASAEYVRGVAGRTTGEGAMTSSSASNGGSGVSGVRPLCNLSSSILVSDSVDSDGAYTVIWNSAPSAPGSITVPTTVRGGEPLTITWGAATDAEGNLSGYRLERSYNGGAFGVVYTGGSRTFTETITFGMASVTYRVQAYDGAGANSGYATSPARTIISNYAPTISGTDSSLGTKTGAFGHAYTVSDQNAGDTLTVKEFIDGGLKRSFTATHGAGNTFSVTAAEWLQLLNGSHSLKITVTDQLGASTTRSLTFTKNETSILFQLTTPLPADAMPTKAIFNVAREVPAGATFTVEACNNGRDASPTWENVTQSVISGSKYFFTNKSKTAAQWGFSIRVTVARGSASGDCFIQTVGGNFE